MSTPTDKYAFAPAIRQPSITPYLIRGPNAERFLEDFNQVVDTQYQGNKNLKVLSLRDVEGVQTVVGSNPLILPIVRSLVSPTRRVGLPEDLQRTLNDGDTLGIRGNYYVDFGFALDFSGKHHEMALDVFQQLPAELRDVKNLPSALIGYGLKNFDKGKYGVSPVIEKQTQLRHSSVLSQPTGKFSDKDVSLESGLPLRLGDGERTMFTASQGKPSIDNLGLLRLFLDRSHSLSSNDEDLAYSNENGRVVLF